MSFWQELDTTGFTVELPAREQQTSVALIGEASWGFRHKCGRQQNPVLFRLKNLICMLAHQSTGPSSSSVPARKVIIFL